MKKRNLLLSGILATTILSGCGSNQNSDKIEITFWHAMNGEQEKTLESLTKKFEKENPNIDVKLENQSSYKDLQSKVTTALGTPDTLPNVTQAYGDWLVDNKKLLHEVKLNEKDYVSAYLEPLKSKNGYLGVPFCKSTEVMVYNRDIVEDLELALPNTPEQYYQFCKTIYEKTGINGGGFDHLGNFYQTYLENEGVILNKNTDLLDPASLEASEYLQDGVQSKAFRLAGSDMYLSKPFASEKVASYIGTNGGLSFVEKGVGDKFNYGVIPSPMGKTIQQGTDLFVFDKNEEENKASEKYIKYLSNEKSQIEWGLNTGYIPVNVKALNSNEYSQYKYAPVLKEASANLYTEPLNTDRNKLYLASLKYMETIANGGNIKGTLKEYEREQQRIFK